MIRDSHLSKSAGLPSLATLTVCGPALYAPEARRAACLGCARDQGLTVTDGTIRTTSAADLARLDACEAIPR